MVDKNIAMHVTYDDRVNLTVRPHNPMAMNKRRGKQKAWSNDYSEFVNGCPCCWYKKNNNRVPISTVTALGTVTPSTNWLGDFFPMDKKSKKPKKKDNEGEQDQDKEGEKDKNEGEKDKRRGQPRKQSHYRNLLAEIIRYNWASPADDKWAAQERSRSSDGKITMPQNYTVS